MSAPLNLPRLSASEAQAMNRLSLAGHAVTVAALQSDGQAPELSLVAQRPGVDTVSLTDATRLIIEWSGARFDLDLPSLIAETWTSARLSCPVAELPEAWREAAIAQAAQFICQELGTLGRGKATCVRVERTALSPSTLPHALHLSLRWPDSGQVLQALLKTDGLGLLVCASLLPDRRSAAPSAVEVEALPISLWLCLGEADLCVRLLQQLPRGDVVVVTRRLTADTSHIVLRAPISRRLDWSIAARVDGMELHLLETVKTMSTAPDAPPPSGADEPISIDQMPVRLSFDVGDKTLTLAELQSLQSGSVVALDRPVNEYVTVRANGAAIGTGHLIEIDGRLGVSIAVLRPAPSAAD